MGSTLLNAILDWLQTNRIRIASYERIVASVPGASTFDEVAAVVGNYPGIFRTANIKNVGPGLALIDGWKFPTVTSGPALNVGDLNATAGIAQAPLPVNHPAGYATPATAPVGGQELSALPVDESSYADYASSAPISASLTPKESVEKLIRLAADADVSGSAVNYANAAVAAATALNLLDQIE